MNPHPTGSSVVQGISLKKKKAQCMMFKKSPGFVKQKSRIAFT
jgi:hypothetical protein